MDQLRKLLVVLIFIGIFVFICLYESISNRYFTLPKERNNQVKEINNDLSVTKRNAYGLKHETKISKKLNSLHGLKKRHHMMAFNGDDIPASDQTIISKEPVQKRQINTNLEFRTPSFLKLEKGKKANETYSNNRSNLSTGTKTACMMSFDSETLHIARQQFLKSKSYFLFHVHLQIDWIQNDSSQNMDDLMHWQYIQAEEQFLVQLPVDFDLLTYNLLVYDHEEKIVNVKLLYNNSNCIEENFQAKLQSIRRLLWKNLLPNDTNHYLCNRNFQNEPGRNWLYYLTTIWVGYDLNCSDISFKNYSTIVQIEKDRLPLVAPIFCYLLSLQFVWIFVLLDIKKNPKAFKTDNEGQTRTDKERSTENNTSITLVDEERAHVISNTDQKDANQIGKSKQKKSRKAKDSEVNQNDSNELSESKRKRESKIRKIKGSKSSSADKQTIPKTIITLVKVENAHATSITDKKDANQKVNSKQKKKKESRKAKDSQVNQNDSIGLSESKSKQKSKNRKRKISKSSSADEQTIPKKIFEINAKKEDKIETSETIIEDKARKSEEENASGVDQNTCKSDVHSESIQADDIYCYAKNDRPYGIKRLVIKLLYDKCCYDNNKYCNNATVRLLILLWMFILLPFGLYRTLGRYFLLKETYVDYVTVVRPSEPIVFCIGCGIVCTVILDVIYAVVFPLTYIYVGYITYQKFFESEQRIYCCIPEDDDWQLFANDDLSYKFTFRFYQFCRTTKKLCFFKGCCTCNESTDCQKKTLKCCCDWLKYVPSLWILFLFIYCFLPIVPFNCIKCECRTCCDKCNIEENDDENKKKPKGVLVHVMNLVSFLIFYIFCLRPIISTFTFLFRSFTYIVFVALPIRIHILRYTLIFVTTITYFVKYFHEIVNMNVEILHHIFTCEEKSKKTVKYINERLYAYIYGRVPFVQRKFYVLFLKVIVVFMYLFITIETFITNQKSLTGTSFDKLLEFLLIIIGPYAISFFLKGNNNDFLTDKNKEDIEELYNKYYLKLDKPNVNTNSHAEQISKHAKREDEQWLLISSDQD